MNLCPACSKPLTHRLSARCAECGALLRIGDLALSARTTLILAEEVARTGYPWDAYDFVLRSLPRIHGHLRMRHGLPAVAGLNAADICHGLVHLARRLMGQHAAEYLESLRLHRSEDIGKVVYGLASAQLLTLEESDRPEDFHDVLDLRSELQSSDPLPPPTTG